MGKWVVINRFPQGGRAAKKIDIHAMTIIMAWATGHSPTGDGLSSTISHRGGVRRRRSTWGSYHSQRRESTTGTWADQGARVTISEIGIIKHCARKGARALKGAAHPEAFNTRT